jgi:hypothetical protein
MIVIINGSFGVGKTTIARLLRRAIPGSMIYDPEWAGSVLMRLPSWIHLSGRRTDDFQDIELWRRSAIAGTRLFRAIAPGPVIVPMAFSRRDYFDEIVLGIQEFDSEVKVYCLRAGMPTVLRRLEGRGAKIAGGDSEWIVRKARACIDAHRDTHYGEPVETEGVAAAEVAQDILSRIGYRAAPA